MDPNDDTSNSEHSGHSVDMEVDDEHGINGIPLSQSTNETSSSLGTMDIESEDIDSDDDDDYHSTTSEENLSPLAPPIMSIPLPIRNGGSLSTVSSIGASATIANFWNNFIPASFQIGTSASRTRLVRGSNNRYVSKDLKVFSVAMLPNSKPELENGGKMILPASLLQRLMQGQADLMNPMLFKVAHFETKKFTHCGVLEFTAEEGRCYMPFWRMHNIGANEGDVINVESTTAAIGKYALFEPQSVDFLDISNPIALLENTLRNFACITKGEIIVIHYNTRIYELKVLETKPTDAINITECDMDVDFAPAVGLPKDKGNGEIETQNTSDLTGQAGFVPFAGQGLRLNGKPVEEASKSNFMVLRGQPDFEWRVGTLNFIRKMRPVAVVQGPAVEDQFAAFKGFQDSASAKSRLHNPNELVLIGDSHKEGIFTICVRFDETEVQNVTNYFDPSDS